MVQASSSTPAADSSFSTSISNRVRDEPYGPISAPPTITTRSAGSTSRSSHCGGGAGVKPRGGDGSAAMAPGASASSSMAAAADICSRALAASSAMSRLASARPPVRSALIGERAAATLDSASHRSSSSAAISSVE
ncbi:Uncharacterised protein [Mycobacterium tuberculosis]|nr:Uncharacterised protein [Mycobacterium tuberculosis]